MIWSSLQIAGELPRCKNVIRSETGVHEPIERLDGENVIRSEIGVQEPSERLKHAEEEGSGKDFP